MKRPGLRARVTATFAAGALILSASMALLSYELTRSSLLSGRERSAVRAATFDASIVRSRLSAENADILEILRTLDTGSNRRAALWRDGNWYSRSADDVTKSVPASLRELVAEGKPGIQRIRTENGAALVVGVPLDTQTIFYEVDTLRELENTLQVLALVLTIVAACTTAAGAGLGWYATRRALRPLTLVADAARDITAGDLTARLDPAAEPELERLTTSFNHMVDQLARRLERDRRFAADVSHELRSPLQTLAAAASVLQRRQDRLDERSAMAARLVSDEVARFQALVSDLIELARSDQRPDLTAVNVADLVRQACRSRNLPAELLDVTDGVEPTWFVDRRRIEQVLGNLLDNARRHGGGPIAVRVGNHAGMNYIEVDDEGPGVSPRDREKIFDRFVRGPSANARGDSDGTGLGLALVAEHVKAHDGRITVTDRPGGGARFRVEIPETPA